MDLIIYIEQPIDLLQRLFPQKILMESNTNNFRLPLQPELEVSCCLEIFTIKKGTQAPQVSQEVTDSGSLLFGGDQTKYSAPKESSKKRKLSNLQGKNPLTPYFHTNTAFQLVCSLYVFYSSYHRCFFLSYQITGRRKIFQAVKAK